MHSKSFAYISSFTHNMYIYMQTRRGIWKKSLIQITAHGYNTRRVYSYSCISSLHIKPSQETRLHRDLCSAYSKLYLCLRKFFYKRSICVFVCIPTIKNYDSIACNVKLEWNQTLYLHTILWFICIHIKVTCGLWVSIYTILYGFFNSFKSLVLSSNLYPIGGIRNRGDQIFLN